MKVVCVSDLHGNLPTIPECDLLLIAGDICPTYDHSPMFQAIWLQEYFGRWIKTEVPAKHVIAVAGNHDFVWQNNQELVFPHPEWLYLQDFGWTLLDHNIWGTPWQLPFMDWAFNLPEPELEKKWAMIPDNTDILVVHGPPRGYGDFVARDEEHIGSPSLTERIRALPNLKLAVFGHNHGGYGVYDMDGKILVNASILNDKYGVVNNPVEVVL